MSLYITEINIRRYVQVVGQVSVETDVNIFLNDQQPNLDPEDLKQIVKSTVEGIDKQP